MEPGATLFALYAVLWWIEQTEKARKRKESQSRVVRVPKC